MGFDIKFLARVVQIRIIDPKHDVILSQHALRRKISIKRMRQLKINIIGLPVTPKIKYLKTQEALFSLINQNHQILLPPCPPNEPPEIIPDQSHKMLRVFNFALDFLRDLQSP